MRNGEISAEPFVIGKAQVPEAEKTNKEIFRNGKVDISSENSSYLEKLDRCLPLSRIAIIRQGIAENPSTINKKTAKKFNGKFRVGDGVFMISKTEKRDLALSPEELKIVRPYHDLADISRYYLNESPQQFIIYSTKNTVPDISKYPTIKQHLERFKEIMSKRRETKNKSNGWWHLHWPRDENIWKQKKIIALQMAARPSFSFAANECYTTFSTNLIMLKVDNLDRYYAVLAVLNSRVIWAWLSHYAKRRGVGLEINGNVLEKIPLPKAIDSDTQDTKKLIQLVKARMAAEKQLGKSRADSDYNIKSRQISNLESELDGLVYSLFELTPAEIAEIERDASSQQSG